MDEKWIFGIIIQAQRVFKSKLLETRFSGRVPGTLYLNPTAKVH
jgi:hypothetical protein